MSTTLHEYDMIPMLCGASAQTMPVGLPDDYPAEVKLDGWRGLIYSDGEFVRVFGGRNSAEYTGRVPYLEADVADWLLPDSIIDGELVAGDWGSVQSIMTTHQAHKPTNGNALQLIVFDVLRLNGEDLRSQPYRVRRTYVEKMSSTYVKPSLRVPATPESLAKVLEAGYEGLVLKSPQSRYSAGRSPFWTKIKPQRTCAVEIIGFKPGEAGGKFDGQVGAFKIRLENGEESTVKCGTDATHDSATNHPEQWLGTIIEIAHHGISKDGKPRHPQFKRRREDKMPETKTPRAPRAPHEFGVVPKRRNYQAMGDKKLLESIASLNLNAGDAYNRCMNGGSGDPASDLEYARAIATQRGIL